MTVDYLGHLQTLSPGSLMAELLGDSMGGDYGNKTEAAHLKCGLLETGNISAS